MYIYTKLNLNILVALFPYPNNEEQRLEALSSYNLYAIGEEKDFDEIANLASIICNTPIALITFIDDKRQWFKSHIGTNLTENSRALSFCTHTIASPNDLMIIPDATLDYRFKDNLTVTEAKINFYAGISLINEDGFALGTLCVFDQKRHDLTDIQIEALKSLAKQVVDKLELRRKIKKLEVSNQELLNSNVLIQKFASMAAHDIKNPLSSILLTSQAIKKRLEKADDESFNKLIDINISSTKSLLSLVDEMLAYSKSPSLLLQKKQKFDLNSLIERIIELLPIPENFVITIPQHDCELITSKIALEQIMLNLISNAIRYNNKDCGQIDIGFSCDEEFYRFEIKDNGIGISKEYHEKIFSNNFTLKNPDRYNKKGSGIGLSTVMDLVTILNGEIYLQSEPGIGTTFFFTIKR